MDSFRHLLVDVPLILGCGHSDERLKPTSTMGVRTSALSTSPVIWPNPDFRHVKTFMDAMGGAMHATRFSLATTPCRKSQVVMPRDVHPEVASSLIIISRGLGCVRCTRALATRAMASLKTHGSRGIQISKGFKTLGGLKSIVELKHLKTSRPSTHVGSRT